EMKRQFMCVLIGGVAAGLASLAVAGAAGGPAPIAAGPASGFVPSHNANRAGGARGGRVLLLQYHGGPVMHATTVVPVFWGSKWSSGSFVGDKVTGLDYLYSQVGGTGYARTNSEYTDGSGSVNTSSI